MENYPTDTLRKKYGLLLPMYPLREVMPILGVKRTTIYKLIKCDQLHPKKVMNKTVFMADDIAMLIERISHGGVNA